MTSQVAMPQITLKAARVNAGLNQGEACERLGISKSTLIKWERNPGDLTPKQQASIERAYKFPSDYIFFGNKLELKSS